MYQSLCDRFRSRNRTKLREVCDNNVYIETKLYLQCLLLKHSVFNIKRKFEDTLQRNKKSHSAHGNRDVNQ